MTARLAKANGQPPADSTSVPKITGPSSMPPFCPIMMIAMARPLWRSSPAASTAAEKILVGISPMTRPITASSTINGAIARLPVSGSSTPETARPTTNGQRREPILSDTSPPAGHEKIVISVEMLASNAARPSGRPRTVLRKVGKNVPNAPTARLKQPNAADSSQMLRLRSTLPAVTTVCTAAGAARPGRAPSIGRGAGLTKARYKTVASTAKPAPNHHTARQLPAWVNAGAISNMMAVPMGTQAAHACADRAQRSPDHDRAARDQPGQARSGALKDQARRQRQDQAGHGVHRHQQAGPRG